MKKSAMKSIASNNSKVGDGDAEDNNNDNNNDNDNGSSLGGASGDADNTTTGTDTAEPEVGRPGEFIINPDDVESPPSGTLASLWYSRESLLHIWVIDKIIGWKTRPKVTLQYKDDSTPRLNELDAKAISNKLINHRISKQNERMELSRICQHRCPVVVKAFVDKEIRKVKKAEGCSDEEARSKTGYSLSPSLSNAKNTEEDTKKLENPEKPKVATEEVLLIKWRGRSHLHCSWERPRDLELYDTTNNTAKGKIKRYYQSQHMARGKDWKKVITEGRKAAEAEVTHAHHPVPPLDSQNNEDSANNANDSNNGNDDDFFQEDDFFQADYVEVERILACDENSMDMTVLARQRALNLRAENEVENRRHGELMGDGHITNDNDTSFLDEEKPWDPEDNVRYVVKWKGMQVSEITWEYWLHIKHDSVDQAEDFWHRQKAPDLEKMKQNTKSHPSMREYKKLLESPKFGISNVERPIGTLEESEGANHKNSEGDDAVAGLKLRSYQLEGVNWLLWNWWNKRSCILADEMGLGKTIQSLCFLDQLQRTPATQVRGPFLVVAPLSLVNQWQSECSVWAPDLNVILFHGSANAREYLVKEEFYYTDQFVSKTTAQKLKRQHITKFHILITTYEVVMKDLSTFSKIRWKALIVDEAHRLKNHQSRLFADFGSVPRDFCLLLTGTPLQNSTEELWSLLNFSDPKAFASKDDFVEKFGQLSDSKQVSDLHGVLRPYLLRRVKEDVEKSLPPKEETILEVTLTPIQKTYYKAIYEKNTSFLFRGSKPSNAPSLMNIMMELRKCCNHPFLIKGAEERIMKEAATKIETMQNDDPVLRWQKLLSDQLVQSSGKMVILMKLLPKLQSGGHKVLIFSQMVRVLDLLEELLRLNKYSYERLDGSTRASSRHAAVERFNKKSYQRFVMLLSTRAGGLGLNLTSADTVIIYDSDWNPQNDLQAMARAHRIGQTRAVSVYRLLTAKTYEMHMFHSASMKLGLDRAVLAHQRQNEQGLSRHKKSERDKESQAKEIDELLKKGAYDVFRDDDDTDAKTFMETDIDQLLERSSRTVTYGNTQTSMSKGLGSFSKASFVTSDAEGKDIDLDDPDFWAKAVGLEKEEEVLHENILLAGEKRSRKQVQVFDPYAEYVEEEQKKKEKEAQKLLQEKEERKRMKEEKKIKREEEKERKKKEREEAKAAKEKQKAEKAVTKSSSHGSPKAKVRDYESERRAAKNKKFMREMAAKKLRRDEQKRLIRGIVKEDPILDRMKQGWEENHRERVISAVLHFGFGRFCKVRNEASLSSLPIQDIEVFLRSYIYQLGLQASVTLLKSKKVERRESVKLINFIFNSVDGKWVINAIKSAIKVYELSQIQERDVRVPRTLMEPEFVSCLRSGVALSSLHCLAFMTRFNYILEQAVDKIISGFGNEELGKRGCYTSEISSLDVDLKARHVTTEELSHAIGCRLDESRYGHTLLNHRPIAWWDRSCDLALIIGTFYHGLSNYQSMFSDISLPFWQKIEKSKRGLDYAQSFENFKCVSKAMTAAFGEAIANFREKQRIEKDNKGLSEMNSDHGRKNCEKVDQGSQSDAKKEEVIISEDQKCEEKCEQESQSGSKKEEYINSSDQNCEKVEEVETKPFIITIMDLSQRILGEIKQNIRNHESKEKENKPIKTPLPSAKSLDDRLYELVSLMENTQLDDTNSSSENHRSIGDSINSAETNFQVSLHFFRSLGLVENDRTSLRGSFGNQYLFETNHYNDIESSNWVCMTTPKENRGVGIPAVFTRHGLAALLYAETITIKQVLEEEAKTKNYLDPSLDNHDGKEKVSKDSPAIVLSSDMVKKESSLHPNEVCRKDGKLSTTALSFSNFVSSTFKDNHKLRHGLCVGVLCCGMPLLSSGSSENSFQVRHLLGITERITKHKFPNVLVEEIDEYLRDVLIPHCLRLCLFGKDHGVGSRKLDNETNDILERKWIDKTEKMVLPDPVYPLHEHSISSIEHAAVLLRRVKLSNAIQHIMKDECQGGVVISKDDILQVLKDGKLSQTNNQLLQVPIWWSPIHDFALLQYASKFGLLTVVMDHRESMQNSHDDLRSRFNGTALDPSKLTIHIRKFLFEGLSHEGGKPFIPRHITKRASLEEMENLVAQQLQKFPYVLNIEQRLNFIIGQICRKIILGLPSVIGGNEAPLSWLYFDLPLFDHDQWIEVQE